MGNSGQDIFGPEDQRRPDNGVGETGAADGLLSKGLTPEISKR